MGADHEQLGVLGLPGERDCRTILDQPGDNWDGGLRAQGISHRLAQRLGGISLIVGLG